MFFCKLWTVISDKHFLFYVNRESIYSYALCCILWIPVLKNNCIFINFQRHIYTSFSLSTKDPSNPIIVISATQALFSFQSTATNLLPRFKGVASISKVATLYRQRETRRKSAGVNKTEIHDCVRVLKSKETAFVGRVIRGNLCTMAVRWTGFRGDRLYRYQMQVGASCSWSCTLQRSRENTTWLKLSKNSRIMSGWHYLATVRNWRVTITTQSTMKFKAT